MKEILRSGLPRLQGRGAGGRPRRELPPLAAFGIEVLRIEPGLEGPAYGRPVAVDHRVPSGVAVAPLHDRVLAEQALEGEAEADGRAARGLVAGVAFPLE